MTNKRTAAKQLRRLTVTTQRSFIYDPERVQELYDHFAPDPDQFGDEVAYALFAYLDGALVCGDVFDDQGDFGQWPECDEEYDPEA